MDLSPGLVGLRSLSCFGLNPTSFLEFGLRALSSGDCPVILLGDVYFLFLLGEYIRYVNWYKCNKSLNNGPYIWYWSESPLLRIGIVVGLIGSKDPSEALMSGKRYTPSSVSDWHLLVFVDFSAYLVIVIFLVVVRSKEKEVIELYLGEVGSHCAITIAGVFHSQND